MKAKNQPFASSIEQFFQNFTAFADLYIKDKTRVTIPAESSKFAVGRGCE
jgi:hypothetical protein